jgi:hypothetical protein
MSRLPGLLPTLRKSSDHIKYKREPDPSPPLTPTAVVPEGTVLDYQQYQTSVNRAVISAAVAADSRSNTTSGAGTRIRPVDAAFAGTAGWMAMAAGVVGMGWGVWAL